MIEKLRVINSKLLKISKEKDESEKQELIRKILMDEKCFFKMDIETAYAILRDLHVKESDLKKIYQELIDDKYY